MICKCGGMTRSHETKAAYIYTCNGCDRRYERKKNELSMLTKKGDVSNGQRIRTTGETK